MVRTPVNSWDNSYKKRILTGCPKETKKRQKKPYCHLLVIIIIYILHTIWQKNYFLSEIFQGLLFLRIEEKISFYILDLIISDCKLAKNY